MKELVEVLESNIWVRISVLSLANCRASSLSLWAYVSSYVK